MKVEFLILDLKNKILLSVHPPILTFTNSLVLLK